MEFILGFILGSAIFFILYYTQTKRNKALQDQLQDLKEKLYKTSSEKEIVQEKNKLLEEQYKSLDNNISRIIESKLFEAMDKTNKTILNLAEQKIKDDLDKHKGQIEKVIDPLKEQIDNYQKAVQQLFKTTSENFGSINESVKKLEQLSETLRKETSKLAGALTNSKVRGRWGEVMLRRIVEFAGMVEHVHFDEQVQTQEGTKPDMVIYLPSEGKIIVDSKAPLENYLRYVDATEADKETYLIKHIADIKNHLKNLSSKEYWSKLKGSIDFVVMFIPIEPAFSVAVERNPNLLTEALEKRIIIATPTTLVALLQTIAYNWQQHEMTKNMELILTESTELINRFAKFSEHFYDLGTNLQRSVDKYNATVGSWETRLKPQLDKIKSLGIKTQKEIKEINKIDKQARSLEK